MAKVAAAIKQHYERLIVNELDEFEGDIAIVWDRALTRRLNIFISTKTLAEHGVVKSFSLEKPVPIDIPHVLYIVAPSMISTQMLLNNFLARLPEHEMRIHRVIFVPECSYVLKEKLKDEARAWSRVAPVRSLPINWYPSEQQNFLHLALPELPSRMLVDGDWNYLYKCAIALYQLVVGRPHNRTATFYCKGTWSARIVEIVRKLWAQGSSSNPTTTTTSMEGVELDKIVLIDRWLDPITPMFTQFTFGGAVDEHLGIDIQAKVKLPCDGAVQDADKPKEINLNNDEVYDSLQSLHVLALGMKVKSIVSEIKEEDEQRRMLASVSECRSYVANIAPKLARKQSADIFTDLALRIKMLQADDFYVDSVKCEKELLTGALSDKVIPLVENALIEGREATSALRLIALQSLVNKGLKPSLYMHYRRLFVQSYGVCELGWWMKLQLAGLIRVEGGVEPRDAHPPPDYYSLDKRYKLSVPEVDEVRRSDIAYAYGGQAPLLVRILEEGIKNGWAGFTAAECTPTEVGTPKFEVPARDESKQSRNLSTTAIFVVGGLTRSEISAIQLLSPDVNILSTAVITARSLLESFKKT